MDIVLVGFGLESLVFEIRYCALCFRLGSGFDSFNASGSANTEFVDPRKMALIKDQRPFLQRNDLMFIRADIDRVVDPVDYVAAVTRELRGDVDVAFLQLLVGVELIKGAL